MNQNLKYLIQVVENETGSSPMTANLLLSLAVAKEIDLKLTLLVVGNSIFNSFIELVKVMRVDADIHHAVMDEFKGRKDMLENVSALKGL